MPTVDSKVTETPSGARLIPGEGTYTDPIVILSLGAEPVPFVEFEYLKYHFQWQGDSSDYSLETQKLIEGLGGTSLDALHFESMDGKRLTIHFDVSRVLGAHGRKVPWYLPDVSGFVRDVKDPSVWLFTLGKVLFTFVVIAVVMLIWFALR